MTDLLTRTQAEDAWRSDRLDLDAVNRRLADLRARTAKSRAAAVGFADEIAELEERAVVLVNAAFEKAVAGRAALYIPRRGRLPSWAVVRDDVQRIRHRHGRARVSDDYALYVDGERVHGVWGTRREVMRQAHVARLMPLAMSGVRHVRLPGVVPDDLVLTGRQLARALREWRSGRRRPRNRRERKRLKMMRRSIRSRLFLPYLGPNETFTREGLRKP